MKKLILAASILLSISAAANDRIVRTINDGWLFTKEGKSEMVNIPHTWNAIDVQDEKKGYYRDLCTYEKKVWVEDNIEGKNVFVRFEGVNQEAELILNGKSIGTHVGGYTAFCFDVTGLVHNGTNDFLVRVNNRHNVDIPPLSADFNFYGGIYRDIELIITPSEHISLTHFASSGVYISTPKVGREESEISFKTYLSAGKEGKYILEQNVFDAATSAKVASVSTKIKLTASQNQIFEQSLKLRDCKIWDVEEPNLYRVVTVLKDAKGEKLDEVENPLGFRTYSVDKDNGSCLNGRKIQLIGTNRHQDYYKMGNALPDEMHVRDINLLKEMGGNFLRISHYPQDPIVPQMCDKLGIAASIEIPIVNEVTPADPRFNENCLNMLREMMYQNFNHPAIIIWCYANEYQHHTTFNRRKTPKEEQMKYYKYITELFSLLEPEVKKIDASRPSMSVICGDPYEVYEWSGCGNVSDILGVNCYMGWYGGKFEDLPGNLAHLREVFPTKPVFLTEYGVGVDPRVHSLKPARFDYSSEWGRMFHTAYIKMFKEMPWLVGAAVWNLNDFYAEPRVDAVPHVNNKGLVGLDRVKKNGYYVYQCHFSKEAYLMIGDRDWTIRGGVEGQLNHVEVFSNSKSVRLFVNGVRVGDALTVDNVASFEVPFKNGRNLISAECDGGLRDAISIDFREIPSDMSKFKEMNVMLGSYRYFEDRPAGAIWIPEQEYKPGSWGYVGGDRFTIGAKITWNPIVNSPLDIFGTENDPIFQTQRVNLKSFKADVPDGQYYVYLYFAELTVNPDGSAILYNVGSSDEAVKETERSFNVSINGNPVLRNFNIKEQEGASRAVIKKFTVNVEGGKGLSIDFESIKGYPVLNAVRIYKCF